MLFLKIEMNIFILYTIFEQLSSYTFHVFDSAIILYYLMTK